MKTLRPVIPRIALGQRGIDFLHQWLDVGGAVESMIVSRRQIVDVFTHAEDGLSERNYFEFRAMRENTVQGGRDFLYQEVHRALGERHGSLMKLDYGFGAKEYLQVPGELWTACHGGVLVASDWPFPSYDEFLDFEAVHKCHEPMFLVCDKDLTALDWAAHGQHADPALITRIVDSTVLVAQMAYDGDGFVIATLE